MVMLSTSRGADRGKPGPRGRCVAAALSLALAMGFAPRSHANGAAPDATWRVAAGPALVAAPGYAGAGRSSTRLLPYVKASLADRIDVDPVAGLGLLIRPVPSLLLRPALGWSHDERRSRDEARLGGLADVPGAPFVGVTLRQSTGEWSAQLQVTERMGPRSRRGGLAEWSLQRNWMAGDGVAVAVGGSLMLMDAAYARSFYAIDAAQAAASGLPRHEAGAGLRDLGVFAQAAVTLDAHWTLLARAQLRHLQGLAASSPVVGKTGSGSAVVGMLRVL